MTGRATVTQVSPLGAPVPVAGSGYGATAAAFTAGHITATVGGRPAAVHWINDRSLTVTFPPGTPGQYHNIVLLHGGVPGPTIAGPRYGAIISRNSAPVGPSRGWTTTLTGVGFLGSGGWYVTNSSGHRVTSLTVLGSRAAQIWGHVPSVYLTGNYAVVKLPPLRPGTYHVAFAPSQRFYPQAKYMDSSRATLTSR